jgi:hypothetical protein
MLVLYVCVICVARWWVMVVVMDIVIAYVSQAEDAIVDGDTISW